MTVLFCVNLQLTIGSGSFLRHGSFITLASSLSSGLFYAVFPHSLVDQIQVLVAQKLLLKTLLRVTFYVEESKV